MEEATRVALLEEENSKLKEENEILFSTVDRMKNSINLLINRYIVCSGSKQKQE